MRNKEYIRYAEGLHFDPAQCMPLNPGLASILYIASQTFNACFTADLVKQTSCTLLTKLSMHALLQIW